MNPRFKLTPAIRLRIYERVTAGEKRTLLAKEFNVCRQRITQIVQQYAKAEASGQLPAAWQRRDLFEKYPEKMQALQMLATTSTPAALGQDGFKGWNYRSLQKVASTLFNINLLRPEAEALLAAWGVKIEIVWTMPDGTIPAEGDLKAIPRRGFQKEPLPASFENFMASPAGQRVQEGLKAFILQEKEAMAASGVRGWPGKKRARHYSVNASLCVAPLEEASAMNSPAEVQWRLDEARRLVGDDMVQKVIEHYRKRRGSSPGAVSNEVGLKMERAGDSAGVRSEAGE